MAGFKAEGVVEALDYDFRPYVNAQGTIPEPTDKQITTFMVGLKKTYEDAKGEVPEDADLSDPIAALDSLDPEAQMAGLTHLNGIYAELCSGTPSAEQISQLPLRVRGIFFAWLQGEVMAPEAVPGGGTAQVRDLRSARAG